jgi:hypothetical protein
MQPHTSTTDAMTASATPESDQGAAHDRRKMIRRAHAGTSTANRRRRPKASREYLARRDMPETRFTSPATGADGDGPSPQIRTSRKKDLDSCEEFRALWEMTREERIEAMWRSQLTIRQLCQWSSRAQHEVPLLGGEFAWIAMCTPEWAEAGNELAVCVPPEIQEMNG